MEHSLIFNSCAQIGIGFRQAIGVHSWGRSFISGMVDTRYVISEGTNYA
jgi:hypothetical protein